MRRQRYARLMGDFWRHPRTAALSPAAVGVHCRAMSYCSEQQTDGVVVRPLVAAFFGGQVVADVLAELVGAGVWKETSGGYQLRDWSQHNITADEWAKKKSAAVARVAKSRAKKRATDNGTVTRADDAGYADVTRNTAACNADVRDSNDRDAQVPLDEGRRTKDEEDPSLRSGSSRARPSDPLAKSLEGAPPADRAALMRHAAERFAARYAEAQGGAWLSQRRIEAILRGAPIAADRGVAEHLETLAEWAADSGGSARLDAAIDAAAADPWMREQGMPIGALAKSPDRYADARPVGRRLPSAAEYERDADEAPKQVNTERLDALLRGYAKRSHG